MLHRAILSQTSPPKCCSFSLFFLLSCPLKTSPFSSCGQLLPQFLKKCSSHLPNFSNDNIDCGTEKITPELLLLLLSRFSRVRLLATPRTAAYQAPASMGFSRQEHWSGLPLPSPALLYNDIQIQESKEGHTTGLDLCIQ